MVDCEREMVAIVRTVMKIPGMGEKKVGITPSRYSFEVYVTFMFYCIYVNIYVGTARILGNQRVYQHLLVLELDSTYLKSLGVFALDKFGFLGYWIEICS